MNVTATVRSALQRVTGKEADESDPPVRIGADETREISFTVNGKEAAVAVAPRVPLSDALRMHLGLTGTHIGCEHGVCGMCTVMIDGEAARSCLVLTCQVEGSEVLTVEGLGTPDDMHPLQKSFGENHALQCGFCTPGMLMSAYDLLEHEPGIAEEELPEQMSGVICRCTGYRNIVKAIGDVANEYPDGIPEPKNCGHGTAIPRACSVTGVGMIVDGDEVARTGADEITMPSSAPSMVVTVENTVGASPDEIWAVMQDTERLARCLPGAELTDDFGEDKYMGRIRVALGPVKLAFIGDVHVIVRDGERRRILARAQAADQSGGDVQAEIDLHVVDAGGASAISATANVHMTGRIAQFGRALAEDVGRNIFQDFTAALDASARGEDIQEIQPPSALVIMTRIVKGRASGIAKKLTGKK